MSKKIYLNLVAVVAVTLTVITVGAFVGTGVIFSNEPDSTTCVESAGTVTLSELRDGGVSVVCSSSELGALVADEAESVLVELETEGDITAENATAIRAWLADMPQVVVGNLIAGFMDGNLSILDELIDEYGDLTIDEFMQLVEDEESSAASALYGQMFEALPMGELGSDLFVVPDFSDDDYFGHFCYTEPITEYYDPSAESQSGEELWAEIEAALARQDGSAADVAAGAVTTTEPFDFNDLSLFDECEFFDDEDVLFDGLFGEGDAADFSEIDALLESLFQAAGEGDAAELDGELEEFFMSDGAASLEELLSQVTESTEELDFTSFDGSFSGFFEFGANAMVDLLLEIAEAEELLSADELQTLEEWLDARPSALTSVLFG